MDFREQIFGRELEPTERPARRGRWISILILLVLLGIAWRFGIPASVKDIGIAIWNMLCDVAATIGDLINIFLRH